MIGSILFVLALLQLTGGVIRGVVVDALSGTPLQRVSVRLQSDGRTTVTDEGGRFEIADVPAGDHELYVSAVDFMLVKRVITVVAATPLELTIPISGGTGTYAETVNVRGTAATAERHEPEVAGERRLSSTDLQQLRGLLANDPMRAIHVLPGVATGDDFRSEFSVRGLSVPHMNFTFEGIASPFLVHTVQQVRETGSIAMVNGDVLDEVSLLSGVYPQRFGGRLGAELDFRMREGSRDRVQSHASISTTDAAFVVEGPIGGARRGSWLVSARKSYLDLVIRQLYERQDIGFGFEDAQAKMVLDVTPRHQLQFAITAGQSQLDRSPEGLRVTSIKVGDNASKVAVLTWRYLPSARFSMAQRLAFTSNDFRNVTRDDVEIDSGGSQDIIYRNDWTLARSSRIAIEGGGELRSSTATLQDRRSSGNTLLIQDVFDASSATASAYLQTRWLLPRGATATPGVRIDHGTLTGHTAASPWVGSSWPIGRSVVLRAGAGLYRQEPDALQTSGLRGSPTLDAERAWSVDAGLEWRRGPSWIWQLNVYNREDRDRLRLPNGEPRVFNGRHVPASNTSRYLNALDGNAHGVEVVLQRRSPNGLSGWLSYAYGVNDYTDRSNGDAFFGDFDQRHTVNLYGVYRFTDRLSASARFRVGSNFPATGYFREQDGVYYGTDVRNTLRVPYYARLDARVNRTFTWQQKRLTLFLEGLNALNRDNMRLAAPEMNSRTLIVDGMFTTMMPIIPSIGMLLEF